MKRFAIFALQCMKRFAIFAFLGPPLGFLVLCLMNGAIWNAGGGLVLIFALVLLSPAIYSVGITPALICGAIDVSLEWLPRYQRLILIGLAGYLLSCLPIRGSKIPLTVEAVAYGLTGLVAAVICSWLTSGRQMQSPSIYNNRTARPPSGVD
jgi:hypothetical protein